MAEETDFNLQDYYEQSKRAEAFFKDRIEFRHHRNALKDFLHWMDRSGVPTDDKKISPGAKAAHEAAVKDSTEKEMKGRLQVVDDRPREDFQGRPIEDQPTSFEDAAQKAHDTFLSAVTKTEK